MAVQKQAEDGSPGAIGDAGTTADAAAKIAEVGRRTGSCQATREMTIALPPEEWKKLGVRSAGGSALPANLGDASLVSGNSRHFLVSSNYDALLEYNCAHAYAISVGLLADKIGGLKSRSGSM